MARRKWQQWLVGPRIVRPAHVVSFKGQFAVEPKLSAPELLSLVRDVSKCAGENEAAMCISAGVDVVAHAKPSKPALPLNRVKDFFRE